MSVTVRHLNADSSFLLLFSPEPKSPVPGPASAEHTLTVLIDPWLTGPSIVTAPWFAKTERKIPSAILHLSELPTQPDVVIVSQGKPDHCHRETLLQLPRDGKTVIAAEPGAAKMIKSWNHFDASKVRALPKYESRGGSGRLMRLAIPALSPHGSAGELTIAFVPAKRYITRLHNAIGITFQAPTSTKSVAPVATVELPKTTRYFHIPRSPVTLPPSSPQLPMSPLEPRSTSFDEPVRQAGSKHSAPTRTVRHRPQLSRSSNTASSEFLSAVAQPVIRIEPTEAEKEDTIVNHVVTLSDGPRALDSPFEFHRGPVSTSFVNGPPTPPESPAATTAIGSPWSFDGLSSQVFSPRDSAFHQRRISMGPSHQRSLSSVSSLPNLITPLTPARPRAISIIYSPHGIPLGDLQPYIQHHLARLSGALPLTLLFHSFDHAQNPWYLGGNIMAGVSGGAEIARALMARCWISAHDEEKLDQGLSVKQLRVKRVSADEVRKHLWEGEEGDWLKKRGWTCDVRQLDVGKDMYIGPQRDLCSGMEGKRESRLLKFGAPG
jgi:hypothetical protein